MSEKEDLSRPRVEVKIPLVKLRLSDLAYLRSLANPDPKIRCTVPSHVKDRLLFLDLIAHANMPPAPEVVAEVEVEMAKVENQLRKSLDIRRWDDVAHFGYAMRDLQRRLAPSIQTVLTPRGEALLRNGEVTIRARKVGCV